MNQIIFQNAQFNGIKLLEDAVFLHWTWIRAMEKDFSMHYNQWSSNLIDGFCNQETKTCGASCCTCCWEFWIEQTDTQPDSLYPVAYL